MSNSADGNIVAILYSDLRKLNRHIFEDIERGTFRIDDEISLDSQFLARQYFRAAFALVEAIVFLTRASAAKSLVGNGYEISQEEWLEIRERQLKPNPNGSLSEVRRFVKLKDSIRSAFAWKEMASGNPGLFDPSKEWWCCLMQSIKIRDRLMHPRETEDLAISMEELLGVYKGVSGLEQAFYQYRTPDDEKFDN